MRPAMKPTTGLQRPRRFAVLQKLGGVLFGLTADFPDHHDRLGLGIGHEHGEHIDEFQALDRVVDRTAIGGGGPRRQRARARWWRLGAVHPAAVAATR